MAQSINRMFDILEALAISTTEMSLTRLQQELQLPLSTVHRLLQALIERGYVEKNDASGLYSPGLKIIEVAEAAKRNSRFELCRTVRPFLQRLTDQSGETSNLVVLRNYTIVYIEQVSSPRSVRMFTEVGHNAPLYCTGAGKAILSRLSKEDLDAYLTTIKLDQLTPHTSSSVDAVKREVALVRKRGYAVDNEEFEVGVRCIAAPIIDFTGRCVGAISVSGPTSRISSERAKSLGAEVLDLSMQCNARLGHSASALNGKSG